MGNNTVKQCVLMQHGLSLDFGNRMGVCCYNRNHPSNYTSYDIDPVWCRKCIEQEANNSNSLRQGANAQYGLEHNHRSPILIDVTPNFNCNLACKICNEQNSSTWAKIKQIKVEKSYNATLTEFNSAFDNIDLSNVREINFSGGEPLLNNNLIKYINRLGDRIDFSNCILRFSTNGTQPLNAKVSEFLSRFKLVLARFSIDDVAEGFEYQRFPAVWNECQTNWDLFLDTMPHNTIPSINRTVSILNICRLHLLDNWYLAYQQTRFGDAIEIIDHFAHGDYALSNITIELKDYVNQLGYQRAWDYVKSFAPQLENSVLKSNIDRDDKFHNTNLKDFDPELYRIIFQ